MKRNPVQCLKSVAAVVVISAGISLVAPASAGADVITYNPIQSRFDLNDEGWRVSADTNPVPTWVSSGWLKAVDRVAGTTMYWLAPAKFLGDQHLAYGGDLSFDLVKQASSTLRHSLNPDVVLEGNGVRLVYTWPSPDDPGSSWTSYYLPLITGSGWMFGPGFGSRPATGEDFVMALSGLNKLNIRAEYVYGAETALLDNVVLTQGTK